MSHSTPRPRIDLSQMNSQIKSKSGVNVVSPILMKRGAEAIHRIGGGSEATAGVSDVGHDISPIRDSNSTRTQDSAIIKSADSFHPISAMSDRKPDVCESVTQQSSHRTTSIRPDAGPVTQSQTPSLRYENMTSEKPMSTLPSAYQDSYLNGSVPVFPVRRV